MPTYADFQIQICILQKKDLYKIWDFFCEFQMDGEFEEQNYEIKEEKLIIGNNPWTVSSLYQFQYFCCPSCIFRVDSKQDFVDHTTTIHPESLEHLLKIEDDSLQGN